MRNTMSITSWYLSHTSRFTRHYGVLLQAGQSWYSFSSNHRSCIRSVAVVSRRNLWLELKLDRVVAGHNASSQCTGHAVSALIPLRPVSLFAIRRSGQDVFRAADTGLIRAAICPNEIPKSRPPARALPRTTCSSAAAATPAQVVAN